MNLRLFSAALLISALPALASAHPGIELNKGDFIAIERVLEGGETEMSVKLSKSGKAKVRRASRGLAGSEVKRG